VRSLLHYASVLWMDRRRPTDSHMLRHEVELAGLLPLSLLGSGASPGAAAADPRHSVLEGFVRHFCATQRQPTLQGRTGHVLVALQLSVHSPLTAYLFAAGQYVCLSRLTSVALLEVTAIHGSANSCDDGFAPAGFFPAVAKTTGTVLQLTAELYELLRLQWYALHSHDAHTAHARKPSPSRAEKAVAAKAAELMACLQGLSALGRDFVRGSGSSPTLSPGQPADIAGTAAESQRLASDAATMLLDRARALVADAADLECPTAREVLEQQRQVDGMVSLAAGLQSLNRGSARTHPLQSLTVPTAAGELTAAALLRDHCAALCEVLGRTGLQDVLEVVDRALPLLPRAFGAALAQDGAQQLVALVVQSLDAFPASTSVKVRSETQGLLSELHSAWSRVFEYALLHGGRYGAALDALLHVAELEEQRLVDTATLSAVGVNWRDALRALVSQACEAGSLGWLCSIPEQQLKGFAKQGVSLGEAISATLETLAAALDLPTDTAVNYYECLAVFQLSRSNYHDGARALHTLCLRSESTTAALGSAGAQAALRQEAQ
jgi:hypothetical protein